MKNFLFLLGMTAALSILSVSASAPIPVARYLKDTQLTLGCSQVFSPQVCPMLSQESFFDSLQASSNITIQRVASADLQLNDVGADERGVRIVNGTVWFSFNATLIHPAMFGSENVEILTGAVRLDVRGIAIKDAKSPYQVQIDAASTGKIVVSGAPRGDKLGFIGKTAELVYKTIYAKDLEKHINDSLKSSSKKSSLRMDMNF